MNPGQSQSSSQDESTSELPQMFLPVLGISAKVLHSWQATTERELAALLSSVDPEDIVVQKHRLLLNATCFALDMLQNLLRAFGESLVVETLCDCILNTMEDRISRDVSKDMTTTGLCLHAQNIVPMSLQLQRRCRGLQVPSTQDLTSATMEVHTAPKSTTPAFRTPPKSKSTTFRTAPEFTKAQQPDRKTLQMKKQHVILAEDVAKFSYRKSSPVPQFSIRKDPKVHKVAAMRRRKSLDYGNHQMTSQAKP